MTATETGPRKVGGGTSVPYLHAEDPARPGVAMCGARERTPTGRAEGTCPLCEAMIRGTRSWLAR